MLLLVSFVSIATRTFGIDADWFTLLFIRYSEFISAAIASTSYLPESQLRLAFNRLDADGSGTVEFADLKQLFPDHIEEADAMMKELNISPHQQIPFSQFLNLMR